MQNLADQLDVLARSTEAVARARAFEQRLGQHVAEVKERLAAAIQPGAPHADRSGLRAELADAEKRYGMASDARRDLEVEHARHVADHAALIGADGAARAALAEKVEARNAALLDVESAKSLQRAAQVYADDIQRRLQAAEAREQAQDRSAVDRLQAAFQNGDTPDATGKSDRRKSPGLVEDLRTARLTVEKFGRDVADREAVLANAERDVAEAVDAVLFAEADAVARDLEATEARARMLRARLVAYSERQPSGYVQHTPVQAPAQQVPGGWFVRPSQPTAAVPKVKQSPLMMKLLGGSIARLSSFDPMPAAVDWQPEAGAWSAYADALRHDPAAEATFTLIGPSGDTNCVTLLSAAGLKAVSSAPETAARNLSIRAATAA